MEVLPAAAAGESDNGSTSGDAAAGGGATPLFSFGLVSDIQYADKENGFYDGRVPRYREATGKLRDAVRFFNERAHQLRFVLHLGDIVDGNITEEQTVADFEEVQRELAEVVLDSMDLSVKWPEGCEKLKQGEEYRAQRPLGPDNPNSHTWNGGLAEDQLDWLRQLVAEAERNGERLIICAHHPIGLGVAPADHYLWNHKEVSELLEASPATALVFAGHYHVGGYNKVKHVHYVTMQAIVEAPTGNNAYAIVEVYGDHVDIKGYGTVPSRQLDLLALQVA